MKKIWILLIFIFIICEYNYAQVIIKNEIGEVKSSIDIFEENKLIQKQVVNLTINEGRNNLIVFEQVGVNEINSNIKGDYNNLFVLQNGFNNALEIIQEGSRNFINSNNYSSGTRIANIQIGNDNVIHQNLIGADYGKFIIVQNGNDLKLSHNVQGQVEGGIEIKMYGNEMEILVESRQ